MVKPQKRDESIKNKILKPLKKTYEYRWYVFYAWCAIYVFSSPVELFTTPHGRNILILTLIRRLFKKTK